MTHSTEGGAGLTGKIEIHGGVEMRVHEIERLIGQYASGIDSLHGAERQLERHRHDAALLGARLSALDSLSNGDHSDSRINQKASDLRWAQKRLNEAIAASTIEAQKLRDQLIDFTVEKIALRGDAEETRAFLQQAFDADAARHNGEVAANERVSSTAERENEERLRKLAEIHAKLTESGIMTHLWNDIETASPDELRRIENNFLSEMQPLFDKMRKNIYEKLKKTFYISDGETPHSEYSDNRQYSPDYLASGRAQKRIVDELLAAHSDVSELRRTKPVLAVLFQSSAGMEWKNAMASAEDKVVRLNRRRDRIQEVMDEVLGIMADSEKSRVLSEETEKAWQAVWSLLIDARNTRYLIDDGVTARALASHAVRESVKARRLMRERYEKLGKHLGIELAERASTGTE